MINMLSIDKVPNNDLSSVRIVLNKLLINFNLEKLHSAKAVATGIIYKTLHAEIWK